MYLSKNFLSAWTLFPAKGHSLCGVYCFIKSKKVFSACGRLILEALTAAVKPDLANERKITFQISGSTTAYIQGQIHEFLIGMVQMTLQMPQNDNSFPR